MPTAAEGPIAALAADLEQAFHAVSPAAPAALAEALHAAVNTNRGGRHYLTLPTVAEAWTGAHGPEAAGIVCRRLAQASYEGTWTC